ncbi:MAG: sugar phosphate isomerase/epimerase [Firmicutes bacterium]|nr:sugar phosphate isomerase/epimerase [Bacillota bacterium]
MELSLGVNLGFAINKYFEPSVWPRVVREMGVDRVQFVADVLNPLLPAEWVDQQITETLKYMDEYGVRVTSIFTSAFTRINHLMHPDKDARRIYINFFKRFFDMGARLDAKSGGSHFGIMTFGDYQNKSRREYLIDEAVKGWRELSKYAREIGFEFITFEPMSVEREMANTVEDSLYLMNRVNEDCGVPMRLIIDIGHAPHPEQRDPYLWLERAGKYSPIVHLQQSLLGKSMHWPFTAQYNAQGHIQGDKVIAALQTGGAEKCELILELSHREHRDTEPLIIPDHIESIQYWKQFIR